MPLALSSGWAIRQADQGCCIPFSETRGYYAVDAFGKSSGPYAFDTYQDYDMTACRELYFHNEPKDAVLYISKPLESQAAPLAVAPELRADIEHMLPEGARWVDKTLAEQGPTNLPERTLAFEWQSPTGVERYVIVGGDVLVVFRLEERPRTLCVVDEAMTNAPHFQPRGVAQLDSGTDPEVIFRESDYSAWSDVILTVGESGCSWRAESVGGSTA